MQHQVANWHVDRSRLEEWEAIWNEMHCIAQHTPGFYMARLLRSVEHPGKYTVYSLWDTRAAWEAYFQAERMQELARASFRLRKGPPISEWFDVVREVKATA